MTKDDDSDDDEDTPMANNAIDAPVDNDIEGAPVDSDDDATDTEPVRDERFQTPPPHRPVTPNAPPRLHRDYPASAPASFPVPAFPIDVPSDDDDDGDLPLESDGEPDIAEINDDDDDIVCTFDNSGTEANPIVL